MTALATADELLAWIDEAHDAVEMLDGPLATTWLRALCAQPERVVPGERRTWYLEEAERLQKERVRDGFPQTEADAEAWRDRQDRREARILGLLDQHTAALSEAADYVRRTGVWAPRGATKPTPKRAPRKKGLSASDATLAALRAQRDEAA